MQACGRGELNDIIYSQIIQKIETKAKMSVFTLYI